MRRQAKKFAKDGFSAGSALILTVVLTSLLAIVGVLFIMMARVNQIASSGLSESKELDAAIETVIAKISEELALDIPRKGPNDIELSEYYDYPGSKDKWLASLEPYKDGSDYKWRQISDVTGFLNDKNFDTQGVNVDPLGIRKYIQEYPDITLDASGELQELWADADGDGVADSKWVELDDIASSKGRPIYAAIRIIDNGGMLNVNTAYKFDPTESRERIDGSSQMQINLAALSERGANGSPAAAADKLQAERCGAELNDLSLYEQNVVWRYGNPIGTYTPFDISDELELRNRFLLDQRYIKARIEDKDKLWSDAFWSTYYLWTPVDGSGGIGLDDWFYKAQNDIQDPNAPEPEKDYSYRHIATTYNMDRIIDPNGEKMVNINMADANSIYRAIKSALDPNFADVNDVAAQIAVNLKDYVDGDSEVTSFVPDVNGPTYYGFERPCVYISELAHNFLKVLLPGGVGPVPGIQYITYRSYAIELHKPYFEDNDPNDWRLVIDGNPIEIDWSLGTRRFHVILWENPNAFLTVDFNDVEPNDPNALGYDPSQYAGTPQQFDNSASAIIFDGASTIYLERRIDGVNDVWITVDSKYVPDANDANGWLAKDGVAHSIQRDITPHKCIRRLWAGAAEVDSPTLGADNNYSSSDPNMIQAHPANKAFTNVGEIGMVFVKSAYSGGPNPVGPGDIEDTARLNLVNPVFRQVFNYLTVWPPSGYVTDPNEMRIKGRININTAPWYVIAQLPWVSQRESYNNTALAEAIVAYRDKLDLSSIFGPDYSGRTGAGFESIGQLCNVIDGSNQNFWIDYYSRAADALGDQLGFPDLDLTPPDGAADDFEERDLIFARISNLVTVRSDVFTAYILVRIGTDGPQKRVIAILDRSDVYSPTDRVKIVAVHPAADPR